MRTLLTIAVATFAGWGSMAIWIDGPTVKSLALVLMLVHATATVAILRMFSHRRPVAVIGAALPSLVILAWWLIIPASNDRAWLDEVRRLPRGQVDGDRLTVENVRNFAYRSGGDSIQRWETRDYDLAKLRGVDLFMSTWGAPFIAHTIVSWDFGDDQHLAISIETRKEVGEEYSAVLGFFRQFELYYVVADERDVIRVRTNFLGEDVRLYHLRTDPVIARAILLDYFKEINRLSEEPAWYNALTHNCTTGIRHHIQAVAPSGVAMDWRVLVNGRLDELGYERENIDTSLPFGTLREKSRVSERAKEYREGENFSAWIREGLPGGRD